MAQKFGDSWEQGNLRLALITPIRNAIEDILQLAEERAFLLDDDLIDPELIAAWPPSRLAAEMRKAADLVERLTET